MLNIKTFRLIAAAAAVILCASCQKINPKVINYAEADFDITLTETRQTHDFIYTYDRNTRAIAIDPEVQELQELWITEWNDVTLSVKGRDLNFEGANVSSSAPEVVKVTKKDGSNYALEYVADGVATITVWNSDEYTYSFDVFAKDVIELEYIVMNVDDLLGHHEYKMKLRTTDPRGSYPWIEEHEGFDTCYVRVCSEYLRFSNAEYNWYRRTDKYLGGIKGKSKYCDLLHDGATFTVGKLYPENASWRYVDIQSYGFGSAVKSQLNEICNELGWPKYMAERIDSKRCLEEFDLDWADVQNRKALVINDVKASRGTLGDVKGKLIEAPHYVFGAKIYTYFGKKQKDKNYAKALYVYCLPYTTEQCDYPPTLENPVNKDWSGMPYDQYADDNNYWKYER